MTPNDPLLDTLVAGLKPVRVRTARADMLAIGLIAAIELSSYLALGCARTDILHAMTIASFWWKTVSLATLSLIATFTAIRSFEPAISPARGLHALALIAGTALIFGWAIGISTLDTDTLGRRLMWHDGVDCVLAIVLLSVPPLIALGLLMRRGASTDPSGSSLAAGIAGAAWGGLMFAFACPHDDPLYIAVWFTIGCGAVALVAGRVLPLVARW